MVFWQQWSEGNKQWHSFDSLPTIGTKINSTNLNKRAQVFDLECAVEENAKRPGPVVVVDGNVAAVDRDVRENEVPGYDRWARNVGDAQEPCGNQTLNISDQPCGAMKMAQIL